MAVEWTVIPAVFRGPCHADRQPHHLSLVCLFAVLLGEVNMSDRGASQREDQTVKLTAILHD